MPVAFEAFRTRPYVLEVHSYPDERPAITACARLTP